MIDSNITTAKKILTKLAQETVWQEAQNTQSGWLYKDELLLVLCGIPGQEIDKLYERMESPRKEILETMLGENPWLQNQSMMGTL